MRVNIVHAGADELTYEIRGIVDVGKKIEALGQNIFWENIGDPITKGEELPEWIKEKIRNAASDDRTYGYVPTKGLPETRRFLADLRARESGVEVDPEDIIFFNGLGDAISKVYNYLNRNARVMGPSPAYSTHSSAEAAHAGAPHITYELLPERNWLPDINDLRNKVHYNPQISGILIINPDNPTGMVYPRRVLEQIVSIAREYDLFLVSDEIYANLSYGDEKMVPLAEICGDVPAIAMRGISKEMPWPGARCGWIEVYNRKKDPVFARYVQSLIDAKMLEVCSTTLPQTVIPDVLGDARYRDYVAGRARHFKRRAEEAYKILRDVQGVVAPKPDGAFYMSVVFKDDSVHGSGMLPISSQKVRRFVEEHTDGASPDKRFAYYLMGAAGICVVPLSGFNSALQGFRVTLLEPDDEKFIWLFRTLAENIKKFVTVNR